MCRYSLWDYTQMQFISSLKKSQLWTVARTLKCSRFALLCHCASLYKITNISVYTPPITVKMEICNLFPFLFTIFTFVKQVESWSLYVILKTVTCLYMLYHCKCIIRFFYFVQLNAILSPPFFFISLGGTLQVSFRVSFPERTGLHLWAWSRRALGSWGWTDLLGR